MNDYKNTLCPKRRTQIRDNNAHLKERLYDDIYDVMREEETRYYDYSMYNPEDDNDY